MPSSEVNPGLEFKALFSETSLGDFTTRFSPAYWVEFKKDGECWFMQKTGDQVKIWNNGVRVWTNSDFKLHYHEELLKEIIRCLPDGLYIGEVIAGRGDYDQPKQVVAFNKFQRLVADGRLSGELGKLRLMLHDILETKANAVDLRYITLRERLAILRNLGRPSPLIELARGVECHTQAEIMSIFDQAVKEGYEGVVVKPLNIGFRALSWLKIKVLRTIDVAIVGMGKTDGLKKNGISQAYLVAVYDGNREIRLDKVGTGLADSLQKELTDLCMRTKISEDKDFVYVSPSAVLELTYQDISRTVSKKGIAKLAMRFPVVRRFRPDKLPKACSAKQLNNTEYTNTLAYAKK